MSRVHQNTLPLKPVFLTAQWRNLVLLNYAVPEKLLRPHLPPGLEFDRFDGQTVASVVAFQFLETRVLGVPWPGFRNFPEINLRFYARRGNERGVVFVREYVPQMFVAGIARALYNEPYISAPMRMHVKTTPKTIRAQYGLGREGTMNRIEVHAANQPATLPNTSSEHWFKEHQWGYGQTRNGKLLRYEVRHPVWQTCPIMRANIVLDWTAMYGDKWSIMQDRKPISMVFALGSAVSVHRGERL